MTPDSQHAIVSPSAAYWAVRNSTQSVDSSPPMKRQRSLKVELVVSSPCHQNRGPRAAGDGARFTFQTTKRATGPASGKLSTPYALQASLSSWLAQLEYQCGLISQPLVHGCRGTSVSGEHSHADLVGFVPRQAPRAPKRKLSVTLEHGPRGDCPSRSASPLSELYENQAQGDRLSGP